VLRRIPERRWGAPADLAGAAVYLASSASRYHTGDELVIDGGYRIY
jgi:NAD(P)-dependent dehydrogenase (short-subunit alcohol dehydrogenase family)